MANLIGKTQGIGIRRHVYGTTEKRLWKCQTLDANGGNFSCIVSWTQLYMVFQLHIVLSCTWVSAGQGSGFSSIRNMFFFYLFLSLYIQCIQHYSTAINSIISFFLVKNVTVQQILYAFNQNSLISYY